MSCNDNQLQNILLIIIHGFSYNVMMSFGFVHNDD